MANDGRVKTYVALLRGINVGGRNTLPMKELVGTFEDFGCRNVKTYIQSGNVVFQCTEAVKSQLAKSIGPAIKKRRGFEPHILLLESEEFERAVEANPFGSVDFDLNALHVAFLDAAPSDPNLEKLEALKATSERFRLSGKVFYLYAPEGIGRSKAAGSMERLLGVTATDRNWRTVCKIREIGRELVDSAAHDASKRKTTQ